MAGADKVTELVPAMNVAVLSFLVLAAGSAAWSAAEVGMAPGDQPLHALSRQPSASSPQFDIGAQGCVLGARQRVVLRVPRVEPAGLSAAEHARAERAVLEDWRKEMVGAGVPPDLLDRAARMPNRTYELSGQEVFRLGCIVE